MSGIDWDRINAALAQPKEAEFSCEMKDEGEGKFFTFTVVEEKGAHKVRVSGNEESLDIFLKERALNPVQAGEAAARALKKVHDDLVLTLRKK